MKIINNIVNQDPNGCYEISINKTEQEGKIAAVYTDGKVRFMPWDVANNEYTSLRFVSGATFVIVVSIEMVKEKWPWKPMIASETIYLKQGISLESLSHKIFLDYGRNYPGIKKLLKQYRLREAYEEVDNAP